MCRAHVYMNCQEKSNSISDKAVKDEIMNDASGIQIMPSPKWKDCEVSEVQDF